VQLRTAALSPAQEEAVETTETKIATIVIFDPMRFMTPSFRASCTRRNVDV
jgi:hypothetical protein